MVNLSSIGLQNIQELANLFEKIAVVDLIDWLISAPQGVQEVRGICFEFELYSTLATGSVTAPGSKKIKSKQHIS
jgi:hypothetical protein